MSSIAINHLGEEDDFLTSNDKHAIIDILNKSVIIKNKKFAVRDAVDVMVDSFVSAILNDSVDDLELPLVIK